MLQSQLVSDALLPQDPVVAHQPRRKHGLAGPAMLVPARFEVNLKVLGFADCLQFACLRGDHSGWKGLGEAGAAEKGRSDNGSGAGAGNRCRVSGEYIIYMIRD